MSENQSVNIRRISRNRAEEIGYYRFLNNENVKQSELSRSLSEACQQQVEGQHVLAISDTTEINLTTHIGRLKYEELGVVGNDTDLGFFLHPTLALNAENGFPLVLATSRPGEEPSVTPTATKEITNADPLKKKNPINGYAQLTNLNPVSETEELN